MSSKWRIRSLPTGSDINPQAHWLNEIAKEARAIPVLLRLSVDAARQALEIYRRRSLNLDADTPADTSFQGIISNAVMSQETLNNLMELESRTGEDPINVTLILLPDGWKPLSNLLEGQKSNHPSPDVELLDVGVGIPLGIVGRGGIEPAPAPRGPRLPADTVVVAIVDDGIGFANHRFRQTKTETRFEHFWAMESPTTAKGGGPAAGVVLDKKAIDALLVANDGDDERVYRAAGLVDFTAAPQPTPLGRSAPASLAFPYAHGTHVLDIAAGYDWRDPNDAEDVRKRRLIGVQLPAAVVAETSGADTSMVLQQALHWILEKTIELSPLRNGKVEILPLIVNFSFGVSAGPMDGHGLVDQRIRDFITRYQKETHGPNQCHVVLPSGNGFHSRSVGRVPVGNVDPQRPLTWRVLPDDRTASFVDIWTPETDAGSSCAQQIAVSLEPPRGGPATRRKSAPGKILEWVVGGVVLARLYHRMVARPGGRVRENVLIALRPTEREDRGEPICPSGDWHIRLEALGDALGGNIELRVQRDDSRTGQYPKGRQSYFSDPAYMRFEPIAGRLPEDSRGDGAWVSRLGTFNSYGNHPQDGTGPVIVVGGYRHSDGKPAWYTGAGPTVTRAGPDLSAVTEESPSHFGVIASGTYTGSVFAQNGTSVAVPAVVRALADATLDPTNRPYPPPAPAEGSHGTYPSRDPTRLGKRRLPKGKTLKHRERIFPS